MLLCMFRGESGIYSIKFMELHMMGQPVNVIDDNHCFEIRKRLASAMFVLDLDP